MECKICFFKSEIRIILTHYGTEYAIPSSPRYLHSLIKKQTDHMMRRYAHAFIHPEMQPCNAHSSQREHSGGIRQRNIKKGRSLCYTIWIRCFSTTVTVS